jgi:hypothetical protein
MSWLTHFFLGIATIKTSQEESQPHLLLLANDTIPRYTTLIKHLFESISHDNLMSQFSGGINL